MSPGEAAAETTLQIVTKKIFDMKSPAPVATQSTLTTSALQ